MNKINAKRRNKRPECGANAPTFLSAVYKSGTQAKKRQAGAPQYGRSMIEMLGVLAIIGVLSVGGIMGYSKAMMRYKINKTIEQITYFAGSVRSLYKGQENFEGLTATLAKKAHLLPDDMFNENNLISAFDNNVTIGGGSNTGCGSNGYFYISFANIPEEAYMTLATHNWSALFPICQISVCGSDYGPYDNPLSNGGVSIDDLLYECVDRDTSSFSISFSK